MGKLDEKEIRRMMVDGEFIELPICPLCGELTDLRGVFLPCCGEDAGKVYDKLEKGEKIKWVRLVPKEIVESP